MVLRKEKAFIDVWMHFIIVHDDLETPKPMLHTDDIAASA
jgi:hypothetical protein